MQPKTNVKKPDRIILFEVGIILALLFVNYALNISYSTKTVIVDPPIDIFDDTVYVYTPPQPYTPPEYQPPKPVTKIEQQASFDPLSIIKTFTDLFEPKETVIALPTLPVVGKMATIVATPAPDTSNKVEYFVDQMPEFPGGENALNKYIRDNFDIPNMVYEFTDKVSLVVEFTISKSGQVSDFKILQCSYPGLGTEKAAKDLYLKMPKWEAGVNKGHKTNVRLTQPIQIQIN